MFKYYAADRKRWARSTSPDPFFSPKLRFPNPSAEERALLGHQPYRTQADDDIEVYYINFFGQRNGDDGTLGYSYPADLYNGPRAGYADSIIISAQDEAYTTLSHEIGHILLNPGLPHPVGTEGMNIINLMAVPYNVLGKAIDSRRITADQEKEMLNNRKNLLWNP